MTGGKFKMSDAVSLIALSKKSVFLLGIRSTHTNGQLIELFYNVFADQ